MTSRSLRGAIATCWLVCMQPASASAAMAAGTGKESARMTRNLSCPVYQRDGLSFAPDMVNKLFFACAARARAAGDCRPPLAERKRSGRDARRKWARHTGPAQSAIAGRILGEILLMIVFGEIERSGRFDLGRNGAESLGRKRLLVSSLRGNRCLALRIVRGVDRGTILGPDIVALTHALRRVVIFPKHLQQPIVGNLCRIEHDQHRFGVTGAARADFFIGRILCVAAGVANRRDVDAVAEFPELALRTPEAAQSEHRLLKSSRIRRLQRMAVDEMTRRSRN